MVKKTNKIKKLILLDSHAILHRAYHALPDFTTSKGESTGGLYGLVAMVFKIISDIKPDYIIACYDLPQPTFRKEIYEAYKANRPKADGELVGQMIRSRDVFRSLGIPIYEMPGFEADDIIGTISEIAKKEKDLQTIIASGDMDTLQLVEDKKVIVFTLKKGINDTVFYDEEGVKSRFGFGPELLADYKGLRGDPSDNIIGVPGIGEKTATTLIQEFGSVEDLYKELNKNPEKLEKAGIKKRIIEILKEHEEEALFSKKLATIRRDVPIDYKLPERSWKEGVNIDEVEKLFSELEFRTLKVRAREILEKEVEDEKTEEEKLEDEIDTNSKEFKEVAIAMWLIDSNITSPTPLDIFKFAKTSDWEKAKDTILKEIKERKLDYIYEKIELPLIPVIKKAEERGVLVDTAYLKKLSKDYHKKLDEIQAKIFEHAGGEFNVNSPKQLGEILFDKMGLTAKGLRKTAGGARSTRESELVKMKEVHPIIDEILNYRELQKLLSTYIDNIPAMINSGGRLHTHLNQTGTTTGRMSSDSPNLQNIPVREGYGSAIRRAFISAPGYKWVSIDYSQIEMRLLAVLSGDKELVNIFKQRKDIHTSVASLVFKVPENEVTKEMRRKAKTINFGIIYGMGVNALRAQIGGTREEAQKFYDNYFEALPTIKKYFDDVKASAYKNGYTETYYGRRRYYPDIKSRLPYLKAAAERMAINAPLQGTAADILKMAMISIDEMIEKEKVGDNVRLLLQVHDELVYEIKEDMVDKFAPKIKTEMEGVFKNDIPMVAEVRVGDNWADAK